MADDHSTAAEVAEMAGALLLDLRRSMAGASPAELREAGDRLSNRAILDELARRCPGDSVLSEEAADDRRRLEATRTWIVDPLDGTREYSEGRSDWAVHVALVVTGELVAGAVALPGLGQVLSTPDPPAVPAWGRGVPRLMVSRSRAPAVAVAVAEALGAELVALGSAGAKAMAVVRGEGDAYAHAGGQYEWDSAAPVAVAAAAGLHVSRIDGSPLAYNRPDPWLPDLLVCRPELAGPILEAVAAAATG